jgi:hypothetical protein
MTLPKGYKRGGGSSSNNNSGSNAALGVGVVIFIIGAIMAFGGWFAQMSTDIIEDFEAHMNYGWWKIAGIFIMVGVVGLGMGLSSGTGRPYGGRRYKGMGGY